MKVPLRRRRVSGWRATPRREYIERELAGKIAAVSALQSDNPGECDDLSCVRSQPEVRFTAEAEGAAELLSAACRGHDQASGRGRALGVFDCALHTRR